MLIGLWIGCKIRPNRPFLRFAKVDDFTVVRVAYLNLDCKQCDLVVFCAIICAGAVGAYTKMQVVWAVLFVLFFAVWTTLLIFLCTMIETITESTQPVVWK